MANKFTKSVLERQAKEAKESRLHSQPAPAADNPPAEPAPAPAPAPVSVPAAPVAEPPRAAPAAPPAVDLSAFIIRDQERSAKNKTFYLDAAVIDAIKAAAAAQKVTDSKLVNDILKKILGV